MSDSFNFYLIGWLTTAAACTLIVVGVWCGVWGLWKIADTLHKICESRCKSRCK